MKIEEVIMEEDLLLPITRNRRIRREIAVHRIVDIGDAGIMTYSEPLLLLF